MDENRVALEMPPIGDACDVDDDLLGLFETPTHCQLTITQEKGRLESSRRMRRNYLSMIMLAYSLTISSPGTTLWSSSSCNPYLASSTTTEIAEDDYDYHNNTSINDSRQKNDKFSMYDGGSVNFSILAKLTFYTMVLIVVFFDLQGSEPGLLTNDVMSRLDASETTNDAPTIDGSDCDTDVDLERQCFLGPRLLLPPKAQPTPNPNMQYLYPQTRRKCCDVCRHSPPLRSHHCNACNHCVATFDHHCFFLETCIGERNHFRFWLFVSLNVICFHVALGIVGSGQIANARGVGLSMLGYDASRGDTRMEILGRAILILSKMYMYPLYFIVITLWMIHTTLALGNSTTFEMTKGPEHIDYLAGTSMTDFPFGRGLFTNIRTFILRDDIYRRMGALPENWRYRCSRAIKTKNSLKKTTSEWVPILWKMPEYIDRDADDFWNHPWQNKYWSCC
jgi:hypothetical protein